jgi:O-antigen ligase
LLPEHLRALVYLLILATAVFARARAPATDVAVDVGDFKRRRNLWFALTLVAFLSGDFWVYVFLTAAILLTVLRAEQNPVALFLSLLFVLPPMGLPIPALGILNYLFAMNHVRLLCLTVLLPAFLYLVTRPDRLRFGSIWPDRFLLAYLAISFCVALYATTFTNVLRHSLFLSFLEVFLPYYVASRGLRDIKRLRDTSMTFVVTALVLAAIALFEMFRGWLLYVAVRGALGVPWDLGNYFDRAGTLRAQASTGHPIALGYLMVVGLGFFLYVRTLVTGAWSRRLGLALLLGGLFAAISRGPWIGGAVTALAFVATGRSAGRRMAKYAAAVLVAFPLLQMLPSGRAFIDLLPFIGTVETANIEYRQRLIDVAFDHIWQSPWFGGLDIYSAEGNESLVQAGGFIDLVNTYIGILLGTGFVGLSFFLGFFAAIATTLYRATRRSEEEYDEQSVLARTLLATLLGILVTIFTTSSISVIPIVYWSFAGIAVAFTQLPRRQHSQSVSRSSSRTRWRAIPVARMP